MRKRFRIPIFIITILILSSLSIKAQDYLIGPDDVLKITVYREEDMEREVRVSSDGYISFPLLGKVKVEELTVPELERDMMMELIKYLKNPQVTVFIKEYSTISVTGQVNEPGSFPLRGELSVIEAIGLAKGFTKIAAQNSVKIMRMEDGKKKTITVKVAGISRRGDKSKDVALKRGDIIYVPESLF
ncbi:MAG: polysaccharide biosynthesis/export family protein [Candidatus Omnitrophota bacterium]